MTTTEVVYAVRVKIEHDPGRLLDIADLLAGYLAAQAEEPPDDVYRVLDEQCDAQGIDLAAWHLVDFVEWYAETPAHAAIRAILAAWEHAAGQHPAPSPADLVRYAADAAHVTLTLDRIDRIADDLAAVSAGRHSEWSLAAWTYDAIIGNRRAGMRVRPRKTNRPPPKTCWANRGGRICFLAFWLTGR